jgi:hypothetical protein
MRWLQGRRTGVIALSNRTYAPMTELTARILDIVVDQGFGSSVTSAVPHELGVLGERLVAIVNGAGDWDRARCEAVFADNVVLDADLARRRRAVVELIGDAGGAGPLTIERIARASDAAATAHLRAGDGRCFTLRYSLAPIRPARIQEFELRPDPAAGDESSG